MQISDLAQRVFAPLLEAPGPGAAEQEFLAISAGGAPRWLLPRGHSKIGPVLAAWSPYRFSSKMKWGAVRAAQRTGCLFVLPQVAAVEVAGLDEIDWRSVGWKGDKPPIVAAYIGTAGGSRKAVVHLADSSTGACRAIVKVPLTEAAKPAILHEAEVLVRLAREDYTCAPRLIYTDHDRGISTQTVLPGTAGRRKFGSRYRVLLGSLVLKDETTTLVEHAAEWQEQLLWATTCESDVTTITTALALLCDTRRLPACWVHGDFAPWNIKHLAEDKTGLLDWEDTQRGGLPLQDAFHFFHMQDYLFQHQPTAHGRDVEHFALELNITPGLCHKLEIAYLAHSYLKRTALRQLQHAEFLLQTLRLLLWGKDRLVAKPVSFTVVAPA